MISKIFEKYNKLSNPAKASLWYAVCNVLQKGISFIVVPIYVRLLTTTEYGQYTVFQSWRDVLIIIVSLNLYCGIFTKAMVDYRDERDRYTSSMQGLTTVLTIAWFIIYCSGKNFWNSIFDMSTITMILMFLYFLVYPSLSFWSVRQRVDYKYRPMMMVTMSLSVLTPVISLILLKFTVLRENAVIWGFLFVQIAFGLYFYLSQFIKGKCFIDKTYWLHALKFNIPLIPHYLSLIVLAQADRIMIKNICSTDKAGIYGLAYSVSMLMTILTSAINNSLVPWIYEKLKEKDYQAIKGVTNKICILTGILTFAAILIAPEIVAILGTREYYEAIWIIPPVSMSAFLTFCYGLYSNVEFYYNKTHYVMIASSVGAVLNIILNWIFINAFGYLAAGYTTLASYVVLMLMHYFFVKKICNKDLGRINVFDNKSVFLMCLALLFLMFLSILLYELSLIRYVVIAIIIVLIIIQRKKIASLLTRKNIL